MAIKSAPAPPARPPREPKRPVIQEKRRGVRMNSRVPVLLEWKDFAGVTVRVEAYTRVVSPYGCLVVLPHNLALSQPLHVYNLASKESIAAMVVSKGLEQQEGWELGIKLLEPPSDFWGLDL
jgi:hypothetical protein